MAPNIMHQQTILVIEDDSAYRAFLHTVLTRMNYNVIEAANGIKGLELARKHRPDAIMSDFNMPGLNGYQVWEELQRDGSFQQTPFILQSSMVDSRWKNHRHPLITRLDEISRQQGSMIRLIEKSNGFLVFVKILKEVLQEYEENFA